MRAPTNHPILKRRSKWLDPDLWSQIGLLSMPLAGFLLLLLLAKPDLPTPRRPVRPGLDLARIIIPDALPPEVIPRLASVGPRTINQMVEKLAETLPEPGAATPVVEARATPVSLSTPLKEGPPLPVPTFRMRTIATGLAGPGGLALDVRNGNIFVAEKEGHRISLITPKGRVRTVIDLDTPMYLPGGDRRRLAPIRSPEGLAMDRNGKLYITEDRPNGRILSVPISEAGKVDGPVELFHIPGHATNFQWEAIAVRDGGDIVIAGSTVERGVTAGLLAQGAIVFRDRDERWWVPFTRPMSAPSAVAFSRTGAFVVYADEISGTLAWLDVQARYLREGASQKSFHSPEGVCLLPDGRIVVAEEHGRLSIVDPETDAVEVIADGLGMIESVVWDPFEERLLVTADGRGAVLEFRPESPISPMVDRMRRAPCYSEGALLHVPSAPPAFLSPLLDIGGLGELSANLGLAFEELTRRIPILAADARAVPADMFEELEDPIEFVRFLALDPNRLKFDEPGFDFALSVVVLRTRSGQIFKTKMERTVILTGNLWLGEFKNHGEFDIPIPFAYTAHPSPRGHAVIHFTGLGRSPDISISLNPARTDESYMLVTYPEGRMEHYRLLFTVSENGEPNAVVSLPPRRQQFWQNITEKKPDSPRDARL